MESILIDSFAPIEFGRRSLKQTGTLYRVYRDTGDYAEVEAESAFEAIERSGVEKPARIARYIIGYLDILESGMLLAPEKAEQAEGKPDEMPPPEASPAADQQPAV